MSVQLQVYGSTTLPGGRGGGGRSSLSVLFATPNLSSQYPTIQARNHSIVGVKGHDGYGNVNVKSNNVFDSFQGDNDYWSDLDNDLYYWTKALHPVHWFPGHIAKAEKELKEQLRLMDVVIEVGSLRKRSIKLTICDDIGERSYDVTYCCNSCADAYKASGSGDALRKQDKIDVDSQCSKTFVEKLALQVFNGIVQQFGWTALERPPR
ncbi:DAR GTPase 3 [Arachis hypogaea]|nr:DAR GTPase 3 [Arachis hypogaea]